MINKKSGFVFFDGIRAHPRKDLELPAKTGNPHRLKAGQALILTYARRR
ncbi:hypothetical protein HMPREF3213_03338 [Heyndrickxia coagulans]|uniref:Uncharacterized protein n=1 Tax=Heyndrickxia coagulans TaxID=1398 RepID=A0A133KC94_HEYCO|nr:hypothetical protein HMPREF3213_03338 [Heyndrickxia coagulans]